MLGENPSSCDGKDGSRGRRFHPRSSEVTQDRLLGMRKDSAIFSKWIYSFWYVFSLTLLSKGVYCKVFCLILPNLYLHNGVCV